MRAGVVGRSGAHAVATVRRGEKQFQRSLGQERVFRRSLEERTVLFWKTRPGWTSSRFTRRNTSALSFQIVLGTQYWDPGESGHLAHRSAIKKIWQFPRPRGQDPVRKLLSLPITALMMASSLAKTSKLRPRIPRIVAAQVNQTSQQNQELLIKFWQETNFQPFLKILWRSENWPNFIIPQALSAFFFNKIGFFGG